MRVLSSLSGEGLQNVNIILSGKDTVFLTDFRGNAVIPALNKNQSITIKKFGYHTRTFTKNPSHIILERDSSAYSQHLELVTLENKNEFSIFLIRIAGESFWFRQASGPLYLGNGVEFESFVDYDRIVLSHRIRKTIYVDSKKCLWGDTIADTALGNWIVAMYYNPKKRKRRKEYIPIVMFGSTKKDIRKLKAREGCLK